MMDNDNHNDDDDGDDDDDNDEAATNEGGCDRASQRMNRLGSQDLVLDLSSLDSCSLSLGSLTLTSKLS